MPALPLRTRLRLWAAHQVDGFAIWLCLQECPGLAWTVWKVAGLL